MKLEKAMRSQFPSFALRPITAGFLSLQFILPAGMYAQGQQMEAQSATMQEPSMQKAGPAAEPSNAYLSHDAAILQALNRFTYGPRPGDLERVRAMGLSTWFNQQLNPDSIDDKALDERLASYPAMRLPLDKLMELYPTNGEIRAAMNNRVSVPGGAAEHAIYADQQERYRDKKKGKDAEEEGTAPLPMSPAEFLALQPEPRFKALCHLTLPQLKALRQSLSEEDRSRLTAGMTAQQIEAIAAFNGPRGVVMAEAVQVKLLRDIYSERQLQEVMIDFWLNHFNVYLQKNQQAAYYVTAYERESIRPFALGHFENLLKATAISPAMLTYLDNSESVGPHSSYATGLFAPQRKKPAASGLNENYARELMELHTIGVNGGYTQKDVTEVAKVFTGWTVGKRFKEDGENNLANFDPTKHEPGNKVVMGHMIKEAGSSEGFAVLKLLASSPQCARFISTKLAIRFVSDAPPPAMIDRMTATFLSTNGDIRRVLLTMVNSPEFFTQGVFRSKVKTPLDYVVSAVRATGSNVESTAALSTAIADLGMPLYGHQTPDGYSMQSDAWNSTSALVSRMNFALALAANRVQGVTTDFDALLGPQATEMSPEVKDKALEAKLLHVPVSARTEQLILAQTSADPQQQEAELRQVSAVKKRDPLLTGETRTKMGDSAREDTQAALAVGLIMGSPEFQHR
jgi:uncharacterized protein (DUF1800 family)